MVLFKVPLALENECYSVLLLCFADISHLLAFLKRKIAELKNPLGPWHHQTIIQLRKLSMAPLLFVKMAKKSSKYVPLANSKMIALKVLLCGFPTSK